MSTVIPVIPVNSTDASVTVLNKAYNISQTSGRPVALTNQYNHWCERGASSIAASLTNSPELYNTVADNAWVSRNNYQKAKNSSGQALYNAPAEVYKSTVTSDQLANLPVGTVLCFQYANGGPGHTMTYYGVDANGAQMWGSDNVNDDPSIFLKSNKVSNVAIVTPTQAGIDAITSSHPDLGITASTGIANGVTVPGGVASTGPSYVSPPESTGTGTAIGGSAVTILGNPNNADPALTPDQMITLNDQFFNSLGPGATAAVEPLAALQSKASGEYSNRQFVSPVSLKIDVEGVYKDIDFLQKELRTNSYNPFKVNAVLSINRSPATSNGVQINNKQDRKSRNLQIKYGTGRQTSAGASGAIGGGGTSATGALGGLLGGGKTSAAFEQGVRSVFANQQNLTQSIFNAGNSAITQNLANRLPNIQSLLGQNKYVGSALGFANQIPGVANLTSGLTSGIQGALNNPLGTLQNVGGALGLDIQGGLPSVSLGSLGDVFNLASGIASSGPPTSISGVIALEQQAKAIICNFVLPVINIPSWDALFKFNGKALLDQIKREIKAELDMITNPFKALYKQVKEFFKPENLKKMLLSLLPDPNEIYKAVVHELTTCDNAQGGKKNDLSGKGATSGSIQKALIDASPVKSAFNYIPPGANQGQGPLA